MDLRSEPLGSFYASNSTSPRFMIDIYPDESGTCLAFYYIAAEVYPDENGFFELSDENGEVYQVAIENQSYSLAMEHALKRLKS